MRKHVFLLMVMQFTSTTAQTTEERYVLFPTLLVDASVVSVLDDGGTIRAELRVTDVLYGPSTLSNRTFQASMSSSGQGGVGAITLYPPLKLGENGIWPVQIDPSGVLNVDQISPARESLVHLPCRLPQEKERWEKISDLVKLIRTVSSVDLAKQQEIVTTLLGSENEWTRRWAEYVQPRLKDLINAPTSKNHETSPPPAPKTQIISTPKPLQAVQQPTPRNASEAKPTKSAPSEEPASSTPWSIIVVLIVAAIGLLWLLVKKRK